MDAGTVVAVVAVCVTVLLSSFGAAWKIGTGTGALGVKVDGLVQVLGEVRKDFGELHKFVGELARAVSTLEERTRHVPAPPPVG